MAISLQADSTLPQGYILVDGQRVASVSTTGGLSANRVVTSNIDIANLNAVSLSAVRLSATNIVSTGGGIAIGVTTPLEPLHVNGKILAGTNTLYAGNQNQPYLIAGTASYTGATTDWGTYGFQHRLKSDSGGVPRVTIDSVITSGASTELFCINGGGDIGIRKNTSTLSGSLHIAGKNTQYPVSIYLDPATHTTSRRAAIIIDEWAIGQDALGNGTKDLFIYQGGTANLGRLSINTSGAVLIGVSTQMNFGADNVDGIELNPTGYIQSSRRFNTALYLRRRDNNGPVAEFFRNNSVVGSIAVDTNNTGYNQSSDYRLKTNPQLMTGGLNKISQVRPVTFTWKSDGSLGEGFIAHELQEVVPRAVTGDKDAVDSEGKPQYQGVDASKLVPHLVSAIQELKTIVDAQGQIITNLQSEIAQLKSNS